MLRLGADAKTPPHFLACDQSPKTHREHMKQFGIHVHDDKDFQQKAAEVRTMIATTPGLGQYFGGVIVHNDLLGLSKEGRPLRTFLEEQGIVVIGKLLGLNRETGLVPGDDLERFPQDLQRLVAIGIHMVKLRITFHAGMPEHLLEQGINQFVSLQQKLAENGSIAAVHEPEFLKGNDRNLRENANIMVKVLAGMQQRFREQNLTHHWFMLKTSFPAPGNTSQERIEPAACADAFFDITERAELPEELPIRFLSGGHSTPVSRLLLQAVATHRKALERNLGSSFSRANLEAPYRRMFSSVPPNVTEGQQTLLKEGLLNTVTLQGKYNPSFEADTVRYPQLLEQMRDDGVNAETHAPPSQPS